MQSEWILPCVLRYDIDSKLHVFEQFEELYIYNDTDKHPAHPGFKLSTFESRATAEPLNVPLVAT